jgi:hypothetical protein
MVNAFHKRHPDLARGYSFKSGVPGGQILVVAERLPHRAAVVY